MSVMDQSSNSEVDQEPDASPQEIINFNFSRELHFVSAIVVAFVLMVFLLESLDRGATIDGSLTRRHEQDGSSRAGNRPENSQR